MNNAQELARLIRSNWINYWHMRSKVAFVVNFIFTSSWKWNIINFKTDLKVYGFKHIKVIFPLKLRAEKFAISNIWFIFALQCETNLTHSCCMTSSSREISLSTLKPSFVYSEQHSRISRQRLFLLPMKLSANEDILRKLLTNLV